MSRGSVQHEVLGAGGGDDPGRQEDVDDRLEEQEDLGLLQVGTICKRILKDKEASKQMVLHNFTTADLIINQVVSNDPLGLFPQTCENYNCEYQPLKMQAMLSYV